MALDVNETTLVQVTNLGSRPLKYQYASRPYLLPPGKATGVPYYAAQTWFGDPTAVDTEDNRARSAEVDRMGVLYALGGTNWTTEEPFTHVDPTNEKVTFEYVERDGVYWHPNLPWVEVKTLEGEVLPVVVVDPAGDDVTPAEASSKSEAKATADAIATLQSQLHSLQLQLARTNQPVAPGAEFASDATTTSPAIAPESAPEPTAGRPSVDKPRGPGRPRKNPLPT
jgi:hypothetical protein